MNLNLKESKLVLRWFDIAMACGNLSDSDLKLYDKITESVEDSVDSNDPLAYNPRKKTTKRESFGYEEEEGFDMDNFSDEDKY